MRIVILATGSRGDVQPYIALGKGLAAAGHTVRLVTHRNFEPLVASHGVSCWPVEGNVADVAQSEALRSRLENGNFIAIMAQMARAARQGALHLAETALAACQGMDHILAGLGGVYTGLALAEKFDLPLIQAYLVPFTPTRDFPSVLLPERPPGMGAALARFSHHVTRQILWQSFRSADRLARREVLDLPRASFWGPYQSTHMQDTPILYGFSPVVIDPPTDWESRTQVTGYWFLDSARDWTPPEALTAFLEGGPPPVYIGFGSMASRKPEEIADLVLEALSRAGQRAVLLSGWQGLQKGKLPDSVFMVDSIPHAWLFPRMAAVVHHGGAGTTAAGLRAGVPSIVIPFFGDQPFWGQRVAALGVGPAPIPRKQLSVERLAEAITVAVADAEIGRRAQALGEIIRSEDGVSQAVAAVNRYGS